MGERADTAFRTTGSQLLLPVSESSGLPLDQVNFLACQLFALAAAVWFRLYLGPSHANPLVRHAVAALLGLAFLIFCFGWYSAHILAVVAACYVILTHGDISNVHKYSMVAAMGYLTACQVSRVFIFHYGILSTDFSGPLMMVTQKVTTLAFQLHDGMCKKSGQLSPEQKRVAINYEGQRQGDAIMVNSLFIARPSLIEYLSYTLNFLSVLVGPCTDYQDYVDFIEGRQVRLRLRQETCNGHNGYDGRLEPSPLSAVCRKLLICVGCLLFHVTVTRSLPITYNVDPSFVSSAPFLTRLAYAFLSIQAARPKFYFAWTLAEAVNNAAGYGFSGTDGSGKPSWGLVCNVNILQIETATSFKMFIDNWNIRTGIWLKAVCYNRAPKYRLPLTFLLSALWHGAYPGYYFTFITAIPITMAARAVRRSVRHRFLGSRGWKLAYDVLTWAATQLAICYMVMPFLLLAVEPTMIYYRSMYFHVHVISILAAIALQTRPTPREPSSSSSSSFPPTRSVQCQPAHANNNDKVH